MRSPWLAHHETSFGIIYELLLNYPIGLEHFTLKVF